MSKVLFVYPNSEGYPIIPLAISMLSGVLKYHKHEVDLFDVTFMVPERLDHKARERTGVVQKVDVEKVWGVGDKCDIPREFRQKLMLFKPDFIAFSIVENNYGMAKYLFKVAKEITKTPILVGGILPTVAPEFFIDDDNVDMLCIGEGEHAILELANRHDRRENIVNIPNLVVKNNGVVHRNKLSGYYDWEPLIFQDWEIFDARHLSKPFMGRLWKTGFFEMSRGCPFNCAYCANHIYQKIFTSLGKYNRQKSIESVMQEIEQMKAKYSLELIFFNDENLLTMGNDRFEEFCKKYKERIALPFFIQTRADSLLDEERVRMLSDLGCITIGIGVESGSEEIRKKVLNKHIPNSVFEKAFENCRKFNIRTTAYLMMGLPFETEANILETVNFCRKIKTDSIAISIFAPYHGTKLHKICVDNGFIEDRYYDEISVNYSSILKMPQISREKIEELYYKINDMVFS